MELVQVAQHAQDLDRAAAFYTRLLGTEPVARFDPPGLLFYGLDGVRLLLDAGAPSSLLYLRVDDLHALIGVEGAEHIFRGERDMVLRVGHQLQSRTTLASPALIVRGTPGYPTCCAAATFSPC